ncbi:hypothetical protein P8935_12165 [Telmatobacter sp. DSM 110680]|uniref:Zinc finger CGNR domain-containing protein n=1 Tax=Telmatobacter sp. DSM 110680 TaxID=3036704 RepID=A0AAU7DQG2_9BACT
MSQNISLPISLIPLAWKRADLGPVSKREFFEDPGSTSLRYRFVEKESKCDLFDSWRLRDDFLGWSIEDWQAFFYMAGKWSGVGYITQSDFAEWQQLLREALVHPAKDWKSLARQFALQKVSRLAGPMRILFDWQGDVPIAKVVLTDSLTAIIATIQVDALRGAKFRVCARHDCKSAPFRIEARHKIYCDSDCAHLVAVRNSRERAANAEPSSRVMKSQKRKQR